MSKKRIITLSIIAIIALIFISAISSTISWFINTQNNLIYLREDVKMHESQIQSALQTRIDLVPNLVETVKGHFNHKEKILIAVAEARSNLTKNMAKGDMEQSIEANTALTSSIDNLFLSIKEEYPDLSDSKEVTALRDELTAAENRLSTARQYYNEKVLVYNAAIQKFPDSIIANMNGHTAFPYFEADDNAKKAPVVDFSK